MICRRRGSGVSAKRCSASAVMSSSVLLRCAGIATLRRAVRGERYNGNPRAPHGKRPHLPLLGRGEARRCRMRSDGVGDFLAVGTAEPSAGVPPGGGCEVPVITLRNFMQGCGIYIKVRVDEPGPPGLCRIDAGDETGP